MGLIRNLGEKVLSKLPPERAHNLAKFAMKQRWYAPGEFRTKESEIELFGVKLPNPFGVAAGFDKYAELHDVVRDYGFGWIEAGSFTWEEGEGNRGKRLVRLREGNLWNRMGLNCISAGKAAEIYANKAQSQETFAVSVAKTHNSEVIGDRGIEDFVNSHSALNGFGIYTAWNISCPNTEEGKTFEDNPEMLRDLVQEAKTIRKRKPVVVKFSPGLDERALDRLLEEVDDFADGYEVVNTLPKEYKGKMGGMSGCDLGCDAAVAIGMLRGMTDKPILGVGGICTGKDSYRFEQLGAQAFLAYTGFAYFHEKNPYAGTDFAHKINREHLILREKEALEKLGVRRN